MQRLLHIVRSPTRGWRVIGWTLLVLGGAACGVLGISPFWMCVPIAFVVAVQADVFTLIAERRQAKKLAREEPVDEWIIELDDEVLGVLTDSVVTDMFWKTFTVVGDDERLFDETLWLQCRFRFRHVVSGREAPWPFCGGLRPTRAAPQVSMRGLY